MKIADLLSHPEEIIPLLKFYGKAQRAPAHAKNSPPQWRFCFEHLLKVSRSFALVIMELEPELRDAICIFYLVLRALDTIEDDTTVSAEQRRLDTRSFYKHIDEKGYSCSGYGKEHEKNLLEKYHIVVDCFLELNERYQVVIRDICRLMGDGMAEHIEETECSTVEDYDRYCYYVAGLVGVGLSKLFYETGRETIDFVEREDLSISMGRFLQKVNIIRDYHEDLHEERTFWPREIWGNYADELADLANPENEAKALNCLNQMVANALEHVPDCIEYMRRIQNPTVFAFCAIPQIMAIGTLVEVYNNPMVLKSVVKLRRGTTAKLVLRTTDFSELMQLYHQCSVKIEEKLVLSDPSVEHTVGKLQEIKDLCMPYIPTMPNLTVLNRAAVIFFVCIVGYLIRRHSDADGLFVTWKGGVPDVSEMIAVAGLFLVITYLLSFFGLQFVRPERPMIA